MKRLAVVLSLFLPAMANGQEAVKEVSKGFLVRRAGGAQEKYTARWTATLAIRKWESGGPSSVWQGRFGDDRQCHWTIAIAVVRRLYLASAGGELFEKKDAIVSYSLPFRGHNVSFAVQTANGEDCKKTAGRYEADLKEARQALGDGFAPVVEKDRAVVRTLLGGWKGVEQVVSE